ncbi:MAG: 2Fe-2S iron-sulfur cluster-binding protein [Dokdonella sp.]
MSHTVTLQASGLHFTVEAGETVLQAALRAGLAFPYACPGGVCGSCKATLISGECVYLRGPPTAASSAVERRQQVLLCQIRPTTDLVIAVGEVASGADIQRRLFTMEVVSKAQLSDDVIQLTLADMGGDRMRRLPGQYLHVLLGDGRERAFSIANAPHDDHSIDLHVRRVVGGGFTSSVFGTIEPGSVLRIEGPIGSFVPREDSERPILMMAGGTGFAPVKALIEHFLHIRTRRPITLYWGVRVPADLYLREMVERWARDIASFRFVAVVSQAGQAEDLRSGLVHEALLQDHPDLSGFDVYMSGPPTMIDIGLREFVKAGLPRDRLYYDNFDCPPGVVDEILSNRAGIHGL